MKRHMGLAAIAILLAFSACFAGDAARAQFSGITLDVPAYHSAPPAAAEKLGPTLPPNYFPNDPTSERSYAAAAKIKPLLYQLPCYCHCDKEIGHTSLLSCYQDRHASICGTCKMELYYAYTQSRKGKTAQEIRLGILRGDWQRVDMSKWDAPYPSAPAHASKPHVAKN
ncbi:MAG TPA: PCYCGC motif-containing (lipo)protein [Candidatus Acidoferrales bacterium]|nr:PCYCGC motif-containing (lipo)protein [Candidatus Acidoferrales bacterium]